MATKTKKPEKQLIKITDLNQTELVAKIKELKSKIQSKKLEISVARSKNIKEVFNLRKELARVKTVLNLKK